MKRNNLFYVKIQSTVLPIVDFAAMFGVRKLKWWVYQVV